MVYKTDAAISKKVKVAVEVSVADGPRISYSLALAAAAPHPGAAGNFLRYLAGHEADLVFTRHGFVISPSPGA